MNKEQTAIQKTVVQWTELAETGGDKPELGGVISNCHLCQLVGGTSGCSDCPYYKKFGRTCCKGVYDRWRDAPTIALKCKYAHEFLAELKTLLEKPMDKKEIERRIKKYELVRECAEENLNDLNKQLAQLTEPAKPVLRQGDYGFMGTSPRLFFISEDKLKVVCSDDDKYPCSHVSDTDRYSILGNIFADLAEIKPNDGFEMDDDSVSINENGHLKIEASDGDYVVIHKDSLHDFILKLRGMELKMLLDAGK